MILYYEVTILSFAMAFLIASYINLKNRFYGYLVKHDEAFRESYRGKKFIAKEKRVERLLKPFKLQR